MELLVRTVRHSVRSLAYDARGLVDWADGGTRIWEDGTVERSSLRYAYRFDRAKAGLDDWALVWESAGTKALVLKAGEVVREVNRSSYHAGSYDYPITMARVAGRPVLVHCPDAYNRLEIEDLETGERLTERATSSPDEFHSRLAVSPDGRFLVSAGWVWHPVSVVAVHDLTTALADPTVLDGPGVMPTDAILGEVGAASWAPDGTLGVQCSGQDPVPRFSSTELEEGLLDGQFGRWDPLQGRWVQRVRTTGPIGEMMVLDGLVLGIHTNPHLLDLTTGSEVGRVDVDSGTQDGPYAGAGPRAWAFDPANRRMAVATADQVTLIEVP